MFGKIISIHEYTLVIENLLKKVESSILGMHVILEGKYKLVGEITDINEKTMEIILIGEFINGSFYSGITHKPTGDSLIRLVNKEEVFLLVGNQELDSQNSIYLGKSLTYDGFNFPSLSQFLNVWAVTPNILDTVFDE